MTYSITPLTADCYEGTVCLINKFDIKDDAKLKALEGKVTFAKVSKLEKTPLKNGFNEDDYRAIHKEIFEPLFDWAGEYRTINLSKKGTLFADYKTISELLRKCLKRMRDMDYFRGLDFNAFVDEIVDIYCSTNFIHPFREGNGRTQRVFITQLIRYNGYEIKFADIDSDYLMLATIKSAQGVTDYLKNIFREHITPVS